MKHFLHQLSEKFNAHRRRFIYGKISEKKFSALLDACTQKLQQAGEAPKSMAALIETAVAACQNEFPELEKVLFERGNRKLFPVTGQYDWQDAHVLYALLRYVRPEIVFEISPNYGYSTAIMLLALNKNKRGKLFSFELLYGAEEKAASTLKRLGVSTERLTWFTNDCYAVLDRLFKQSACSVDILFMDSDHTYEFAARYAKTLFPHVRPGGLIHVHDVSPDAKDNLPFSSWEVNGEDAFLATYLKKQNIPAKDYIYGKTLLTGVNESVRKVLSEKPRYRDNFEPLSKERSYSFWMIKR